MHAGDDVDDLEQVARPRQPQWARLLCAHDCSTEPYRCCVACEGHGTVTSRRRRRRDAGDPRAPPRHAPPPKPPSFVPCKACDGLGVVPGAGATLAASDVRTVVARGGGVEADATLPEPGECGGEAVGVAIVGAGIGGLALALALQQRGMACAVFERDGAFAERAQGYGLTLQQGGRAIRALGLASAVEAAGVSSVRHYSFDAVSGEVLGEHGAAARAAAGRSGPSEASGEASSDAARGEKRSAVHKRNIHLPRQSLRALLYARLQPGTVRWGQRFRAVSAAPCGSLRLEFDERDALRRRRCHADVLVGADGIRSAVRRALQESVDGAGGGERAAASDAVSAPRGSAVTREVGGGRELESGLRSLEMMVILGFAATAAPSEAASQEGRGAAAELFGDGTTVAEFVDGSNRLYAMPFEARGPDSPASTMWQLSMPLAASEGYRLSGLGGAALRAEALRCCATWGDAVCDLLAATRDEDVTGYPCFDREPADHQVVRQGDASLPTGRATLIGDASHPMAPFKGQGANQALLDAVDVARALYDSELGDAASESRREEMARRQRRRSRASIPAALAQYEQGALPRVTSKILASRASTELLHSPYARAVVTDERMPLTRARAAAEAKESAAEERAPSVQRKRMEAHLVVPSDEDQELSAFTKRVHAAVRRIPPGTTATYGQIAAAADNPNAYRAVASVLSKNHNRCAKAVEEGRCAPENMVPCHRVVAASGKHVGYLGDTSDEAIQYRRALLAAERQQLEVLSPQ